MIDLIQFVCTIGIVIAVCAIGALLIIAAVFTVIEAITASRTATGPVMPPPTLDDLLQSATWEWPQNEDPRNTAGSEGLATNA